MHKMGRAILALKRGAMETWVAFAVLLVACSQPCCGMPVDSRDHFLKKWSVTARDGGEQSSEDLCYLCLATMELFQDYVEANSTIDEIYPAVEPLCVFFVNKTMRYYGPYMCPGIILSYGPVVLQIVARGALKPQELCYLLHLCKGSNSSRGAETSLLARLQEVLWEKGGGGKEGGRGGGLEGADLSSRGPEQQLERRRHKEAGGEGGRVAPSTTSTRTKDDDVIIFLQISDIHLDRQFSEGSPSMCNLYLCCRAWYNGTGPAGHYGDYHCDLPLVTLDLLAEAVSQLDPQPDFIIYTGDNSPHDLWNETWSSQFEATEFLVNFFSQQLPKRVIYPAIGNHETWPESEYLGTLPEYQELNKKLAQFWQSLVPLPQSALDTISEGAYYTLLIEENLRLISFNSDYGYELNLFTALNNQNPSVSRQHQWITETLEQAEAAGEKVLIIAHVPPGDGSSLTSYEEFYLNLTRRFKNTIVGHLFGHTHHDEFALVQDEAGVYGTIMMCPSVTPYGRSNPSFRLFSMDSHSYQLLGYQQYHLNLTQANEMAQKGLKPKFELAYTTSDLYGLEDLSPDSWADLVERFSNYPELVSRYCYNKFGQSSPQDKSCNVYDTICSVSNILSTQKARCLAG